MIELGSNITALWSRPTRMPGSIVEDLGPSTFWTGLPASGFTITPTDPARTTAKPACRLVEVPNQRFTDALVVSAMAFANDNGTLIGGVDRVRFHFEGNAIDVVAPALRSFTRRDGSTYVLPCYSARLTKPSGTTGEAHLYIEAIPADATMQSRVIGPFSYFMEDTEHDIELEIAASEAEVAGERYQTLRDALLYTKAQNSVAPKYTFTEDATIGVADLGDVNDIQATGPFATITHAPGVTVTFGNTSLDTNNAQYRPKYKKLHFRGGGIVFDFRNVTRWRVENDQFYWLEGVTITNSDPAGPNALFAKGKRPTAELFERGNYYTDVHCEWADNAFGGAPKLIRGAYVEEALNDFGNNAECSVGNKVLNGDNTVWWNNPSGPAISIIYDSVAGSGAAATVEKSGGGNSDGVYTFKVDGSTVGTFTALNSWTAFEGDQYSVSSLVDYINGDGAYAGTGLADSDPGFSATLLDDSRQAAQLSLTGGNGKAVPAQDITDTALELFAEFDLHSDFLQCGDNADLENHIIAFNDVRNWGGQIIHIGGFTDRYMYDSFVINNLLDGVEQGYISNPRDRIMAHFVFAHNTFNDQVFTLGDGIWDGYSMIANNFAAGLAGDATGTDLIVKNNHVAEALPDNGRPNSGSTITGGTGDTVGGTKADLFVDEANHDFTPAGVLVTNLKAPVVENDRTGKTRALNAPVGALC
ncbi:MAG: hypothetical protein RIB52_00225 [Erythrobacter sp.]|uniref:hypothetical protein n=1 Tax=Erythrobacter sp. TaxID=1042 RepID=UPI0032EAD0F9